MSMVAIQQMADRVAQLLEEKHGLGGRDLAAKLRRGKRLLPRKVRDAAERLAAAAEKARNPKLMGQVDMGQVADAYDVCVRHLAGIDPAERRRGTMIGMVESVGIGVLIFGVVIVGIMYWLGYL
ncbi:hypothetical protein MCELHM10_02017 [Paracoccaceae bacterium]